jgi:hypothetical protein
MSFPTDLKKSKEEKVLEEKVLKEKWNFALVAAMGLIATGCATIVHGSKQDVYVTSKPSGAVVRVQGTATTTPGILTLDRKRESYVLVFEKEGYKAVEVRLRRTMDGWFFGNVFFGWLVGFAIDFANGSAYRLTPAEVDVIFGETGVSKRIKEGDVVVFVDMEQLKGLGIKPTEKIL